ncbi:MAG: type I glutamate--ammonia ligase [Dehalococcoidia bacterium]|nr:type I glutamate--ammonia ligase [Dehalococcoidia bacterium]
MTASGVMEIIREKGLKMVDLKFVDLPGQWQHFSIPSAAFGEEVFEEGAGFDGSSIRGFQSIHESDMLLIPDPTTAIVDPVCEVPTLSLVCSIKDPISGEWYSRDPRFVAKKAETYLKETGIADVSYWGPELEHFLFDSIRFDQNSHSGFYFIDSVEGIWNSGNGHGANLGYQPRHKEGYFPVPPTDKLQDLRSKIALTMIEVGIDVEAQHHEVATAGQGEFDMKYDTLTRMADKVMLHKYIVKNMAAKNGMTATFMPKPLFQDNGSGMHTHQSLWKGDTNLCYDAKGYGLISQTAKHYIGGLLAHSAALLAFCAPTTNSYRRLVPGYEAPINLVYSKRNRSACVRIPMYSTNPKARRIEYRPPDPLANPYLAFPAMLLAGLDGIKRKLDPGEPVDEDIYELGPEAASKIKSTPGSLEDVLNALEADCDFLRQGGVFTDDLIETWLSFKRQREMDPVRLRPHPWEFYLYYDA